jgi:hypothetical protein
MGRLNLLFLSLSIVTSVWILMPELSNILTYLSKLGRRASMAFMHMRIRRTHVLLLDTPLASYCGKINLLGYIGALGYTLHGTCLLHYGTTAKLTVLSEKVVLLRTFSNGGSTKYVVARSTGWGVVVARDGVVVTSSRLLTCSSVVVGAGLTRRFDLHGPLMVHHGIHTAAIPMTLVLTRVGTVGGLVVHVGGACGGFAGRLLGQLLSTGATLFTLRLTPAYLTEIQRSDRVVTLGRRLPSAIVIRGCMREEISANKRWVRQLRQVTKILNDSCASTQKRVLHKVEALQLQNGARQDQNIHTYIVHSPPWWWNCVEITLNALNICHVFSVPWRR